MKLSNAWLNCIFSSLLMFLLLTPDLAQAASGGALFSSGTNFLQALQDLLTNTWVRIIGVISVASLGIAWMIGRISFLWAASVIGGMVIAFGAVAIVNSVEGVV